MVIWGIDPGINGALAAFHVEEGQLDIHDMPIMEVRGKKTISPQLVKKHPIRTSWPCLHRARWRDARARRVFNV